MIDAYAHVGLPRFQSVEDCRRTMTDAGIRKALVCAFDACPDLAEVHRAITTDPDTFRGLGLPIGGDRTEVEAGIARQIEAGFVGLRYAIDDVLRRPWSLEALGAAGGFPLVIGDDGWAQAAPHLLAYLERHPAGMVIGGHFAGPTRPDVLEAPGPLRDLFAHPRFAVVFSRQRIFDPAVLADWSRALVEMLGWTRILFGTEAPVLHWRDEPLGETPAWIERFAPTPEQRAAFFVGNAERLIFGRPAAGPAPLSLPFDPWRYVVDRPVPMWPFGLQVHTSLPGRLVRGWIDWGGEARGPLRDYLQAVLDTALPKERP